MSSSTTPFPELTPVLSAPNYPEDNASASSPVTPGLQANEHLAAATISAPTISAPQYQISRTPPISESQPKQDLGYFFLQSSSERSRQATFRPMQTSLSDRHSALLSTSPGNSSNRSLNSSENDRSICSFSSSEYLTPPNFQPDCDNPPYKPRKGDPDSLTMMKLRRAQTIPGRRTEQFKADRKRKRRCRHKRFKMNNYHHSDWSLPGCQIAPTAPSGQQELCTGYIGSRVPMSTSYGNTDTFGRHHPRSSASQSGPRVTRRWSSVEIGAHQVPLAFSMPLSVPRRNLGRLAAVKTLPPVTDLGPRARSSSHVRVAIENDLLRTVRHRLTLREIRPMQLELPDSITLRRASGATFVDNITASPSSYEGTMGDYREASQPMSQHNDQPSATYLITSKDIDSITDLIAAKIQARYRRQNARKSTPPRKCTTTSSTSRLSDPVVAIRDETMAGTPGRASDYLQVRPEFRTRKDVPRRIDSFQSGDEVIWQGSVTPCSESSLVEEDSGASPHFISPEMKHPEHQTSDTLPLFPKREGHTAFDPENARSSIDKWQNDISLVVTSSDDDGQPKQKRLIVDDETGSSTVSPSSPNRERPKIKPFFRYKVSANMIQDVESFPPLPRRKETADWHSPLPEMETHSPLLTSRALDDPNSMSEEVTPKASQMSWARSAEVSQRMSMEFNWNIDACLNPPELHPPTEALAPDAGAELGESRRKSVVKLHPHATPRTGSPCSIGSSIGANHRERIRCTRSPSPTNTRTRTLPPSTSSPMRSQRPSTDRRGISAPQIYRVRTIDNAQKGEHRDGYSKWRPPSICPPPRTPSPSESEDAPEQHQDEPESPVTVSPPRPSHLERIRSVFRQGMGLSRDISPPSVKVDQIGIYGQITGVRSNGPVKDKVVRQGRVSGDGHECDDAANHPDRPGTLNID